MARLVVKEVVLDPCKLLTLQGEALNFRQPVLGAMTRFADEQFHFIQPLTQGHVRVAQVFDDREEFRIPCGQLMQSRDLA